VNRFVLPLCILSLALVGCGGDPGDGAATATSSSYTLDADVDGAVDVKAAMQAEPGTQVAVFGRVQEINRDGYAVFYIVDDSVPYCGKGQEDCGCNTPWDFCCHEDDMRTARMPVELRADGGMPVKSDNLGLRLLDLVAVKGTLEKTTEGGLVLVADRGWFTRERPDLPDGLHWPAN
jgi:hypothetical protein